MREGNRNRQSERNILTIFIFCFVFHDHGYSEKRREGKIEVE